MECTGATVVEKESFITSNQNISPIVRTLTYHQARVWTGALFGQKFVVTEYIAYVSP